jgi:hypothetical protein
MPCDRPEMEMWLESTPPFGTGSLTARRQIREYSEIHRNNNARGRDPLFRMATGSPTKYL